MRAKKLDRMRPRPYHIAFGSLVRGTTQMRYVFYSLAALPVGALTFSAGASDLAVPPWRLGLGSYPGCRRPRRSSLHGLEPMGNGASTRTRPAPPGIARAIP